MSITSIRTVARSPAPCSDRVGEVLASFLGENAASDHIAVRKHLRDAWCAPRGAEDPANVADAERREDLEPGNLGEGPGPVPNPAYGSGFILVIAGSEQSFCRIAACLRAEALEAVPFRVFGAASTEDTLRRIEACALARGIDGAVMEVAEYWSADSRTDLHPWGTPWAAEADLDKLGRGNFIAACALRVLVACLQAGLPAALVVPSTKGPSVLATAQGRWVSKLAGCEVRPCSNSDEEGQVIWVNIPSSAHDEDRPAADTLAKIARPGCLEDAQVVPPEAALLARWRDAGWQDPGPSRAKLPTHDRAALDELRAVSAEVGRTRGRFTIDAGTNDADRCHPCPEHEPEESDDPDRDELQLGGRLDEDEDQQAPSTPPLTEQQLRLCEENRRRALAANDCRRRAAAAQLQRQQLQLAISGAAGIESLRAAIDRAST